MKVRDNRGLKEVPLGQLSGGDVFYWGTGGGPCLVCSPHDPGKGRRIVYLSTGQVCWEEPDIPVEPVDAEVHIS